MLTQLCRNPIQNALQCNSYPICCTLQRRWISWPLILCPSQVSQQMHLSSSCASPEAVATSYCSSYCFGLFKWGEIPDHSPTAYWGVLCKAFKIRRTASGGTHGPGNLSWRISPGDWRNTNNASGGCYVDPQCVKGKISKHLPRSLVTNMTNKYA